MCGIVALIAKNAKLPYFADDIFSDLLRMDSIRGTDSTGAFGVTSNGVVDMIKGYIDGYMFVFSIALVAFSLAPFIFDKSLKSNILSLLIIYTLSV